MVSVTPRSLVVLSAERTRSRGYAREIQKAKRMILSRRKQSNGGIATRIYLLICIHVFVYSMSSVVYEYSYSIPDIYVYVQV